jgi:hypothetical protein
MPNKALEPTAYSVRSCVAPASGGGSPPALSGAAPLNGASWLRPALVARGSRAGGAPRRLTTAGANICLIARDPCGVLALDRCCSARPVRQAASRRPSELAVGTRCVAA